MVKISIWTLVWLFAIGLFFSASAQVPTVSSVTPNIAPPGSSVTITGTNFNTTPANNIVYFGATKATVTTASATSITATVPVGATLAPVSVNNIASSLQGYSQYPFLPTWDNSGYLPGIFNYSEGINFTTGLAPLAVSLGDIDGDGKPDLVVANSESNTISVYRNTSSTGTISAGSFAAKVDFATGAYPYNVAIGDIDGDGKLDLAVANYHSNTISVFRNTASSGSITTGSFATKVDFPTGSSPTFVIISEIDGDGKPDLAVCDFSDNTVSILRNIGSTGTVSSGSFASRISFATGIRPLVMAAGDLDGDGKVDLALVNWTSNTVSVLRNQSSSGSIASSSFAAKVDFSTGSVPHGIALGDIDGDGKQEIAVVNSGSNSISIFKNTSVSGAISSSSFASRVDFTTGNSPVDLTIGDIDGDGKADIEVVNSNSNTVSLFRNVSSAGVISSGSLTPKVDFSTGSTPASIAVCDLDGDGKQDIIVANTSSSNLSIFRNNPLVAPPVITSASPNPANPGTTITITGNNFNSTPANNIVYFGATKATVSAASTTSITATVPTGAVYAPITVNNVANNLIGAFASRFLPTYNNSTFINSVPRFDARTTYAGSGLGYGIAAGDIDGDGKPDVVVCNAHAASISVYRNISTTGPFSASTFAAGVVFSVGSNPGGVAISDIDRDGKLDIVVTNNGSNSVSVLRNTSTYGLINASSFAAKVDFNTGTGAESVQITDMDLDGKPDIIVANYTAASISVLRNTSVSGVINSLSFATKVDFSVGSFPHKVATGDIDGDGRPEMLVTNSGGNTISLFRNISSPGSITTSSFATRLDLTTGTQPIGAEIADVDGDGKADVLVSCNTAGFISIFRNISVIGTITSGSFATRVDVNSVSVGTLRMGDANGDGRPDIFTTGGMNAVVILNNTTVGNITSGSFSANTISTPGDTPNDIAVIDIDGDNRPDLLCPNSSSTGFSALRNNPLPAPPGIFSLSPNIAPPGAPIIITGSNFNTTPANNIVYFGATKATVTAASTTSITATVPVGATYAPITVNNVANNLIGTSASRFLPNYNNSTFINSVPRFDARTIYAGSSLGYGIAAGDIDGDGKPDVVICNIISSSISVYRNTASTGSFAASTFASRVDFSVGSGPNGVAITDVDADGKLDVVVSNYTSNTVSVLRNTATSGVINSSSLATKVDFTTGTGAEGIQITDLDLDGKPDIIVPNYTAGSISVLRNTTTSGVINSSSFAAKVDFAVGSQPERIVTGDIDGDGRPEMLVTNSGGNTISLFRNISSAGTLNTSSFATRLDLVTGTQPVGAEIADVDGDGKADIVVACNTSGFVSVFRNIASLGTITSGSFAARVDITTISNPGALRMGDANGDGKPDIFVTGGSNAAVILNNTTLGSVTSGSFASTTISTPGDTPNDIAVVDIDGDNLPDLLSPNSSSTGFSALRNNPLLAPPSISTVSPNPANPGTSVTITGSNFNTTPANNIVYFGATKATVTAAGTTTLTATVPVGATYAPVSVNNTASSLQGYSQYPFLPKYDNSGFIPSTINFSPKVDFTTGINPYEVKVGDIDGDGKTDIVVCNYNSTSISVFRNTSTSGSLSSSSFATKVDFVTGTQPRGLALGDLDGDGKTDIAVVNFASNTLSVFRNTSSSGTINSSSFAAKVDFSTGSAPFSVTIDDFDKDGRADIAVVNSSSNTISVYRNTGTPGITSSSFASRVDFSCGTDPRYITSGDVDSDGKPELVVANNTSNSVMVFRNTATPSVINTSSFASAVAFSTASAPGDVALVDIDGDGKSDIVATTTGTAGLSIFRNTTTAGAINTGSFSARIDFPIPYPTGVDVGDINGDGKSDLVVSTFDGSIVSVFRNTATSGSISSSSLAAYVSYSTGTNANSVAVSDFDGDGMPDISVANYNSTGISVLRNNPLLVPPTVTSVSPNPANPGSSVTITGSNFNTTPANNIVYFGATKATVTAAGTTSLTATVPVGATFAPVSVLNNSSSLVGFAQNPFLPTYNNAGSITGTVNFDTKVDFTTGAGPYRVVFGDIDGDGKSDMVVVNRSSGTGGNSISVYRNTSSTGTINSSSFAAKVDFSTAAQPGGVALGDIDGDGKLDIAVTSSATNVLSVFRNIATSGVINSSSLAARVDFTTNGITGYGVIITDLDRDGKSEIAMVNQLSNTFSVFRNTATTGVINSSSLASPVDFTTGANPGDIAFGDFDGDGKTDIATTNYNTSGSISVFRNTAIAGTINSASFATKVDFTVNAGPYKIAVVDIDGDGKLDIVTGNSGVSVGINNFSILRNTSTTGTITTGSFAAKVDFTTGVSPYVAIADIDGDSKPDIITAHQSSNFISVFRNIAISGAITSGSFSTRTDFPITGTCYDLAVGDLDGDGKPEVAVCNNSTNNVSVFKNTPLIAPPTVTSVSPNPANPGTSVTITGTNFNTTPANNIVYFGATKATVTAAGTTSLTATVPTGATYAPVSVNNTASSLQGYSQYPFLPSYNNSEFVSGIINFNPKVDFTSAGVGVQKVKICDLDGDGYSDLVTTSSSRFSVLRNTGLSSDIATTSFEPRIDFTSSTAGTNGISIGDIDGDGKSDVVAVNNTEGTISVFRNTSSVGLVSFATKINFTTGTNPSRVSIGDIDGDGKPEIVVNATGLVSIFRNTCSVGSISSASFADRVDISLVGATDLNMGDIDGDGKSDIVVANGGSPTGNIYVLRNISTPGSISTSSFATAVSFLAGNGPTAVTVGDIDADGKLDIACVNSNSRTLSIYRNQSSSGTINSGSLASKVDFATTFGPAEVGIGDFDGDGKADIAIPNSSASSMSVFRNTSVVGTISSSSFASRVDFVTGANPVGIAVGDLNGDLKADIAVSCFVGGSGTIAAFQNVPLLPISGTFTLCVDNTTTLTNTTTGGTWSSSATGIATVGSTGVVTGVAAGTAVISYTVAGGSATTVVTVNALPDAGTITGTASVCTGSTTTLSNTASGGIWSSGATGVATVGSTGIVSGVAAGTAVISYTVTNGCGSASASVIVTVNPLPNAGTITGTASVCTGNTTTLSNAISGGVWSSGTTGIATVGSTGVVTGVAAGTAVISYTVTNSCGTATVSAVVTVNPLPNAGTITGTTYLNAGSSVVLSNTVTGGIWNSSNSAVATVGSTSGTVNGIAAGTAIISYGISNSCGIQYATKIFTVNPFGSLPCASWTEVGSGGVSAGSAGATVMAIDNMGVPYIGYTASGGSTVKKYTGTTWITVGGSGFSTDNITSFSMALDSSYNPFVTFMNVSDSGKMSAMRYNGSNWVYVGAPGFNSARSDIQLFSSLAIDRGGTPYVSFCDESNGNKITVMKYNGTSWITVGAAGFSASSVSYTSIAIDTTGIPYVAYADNSIGGKATVKKYVGGSWVTVGSPGFSGVFVQFTTIALDASGTPYVVYRESGSTLKARVMKFNGATWVALGSTAVSDGEAEETKITIDVNGTPYVLYKDYVNDYGATVRKFDGTNWITVGSAGISVGEASYNSIAISSEGVPYISYRDNANSYKATCMVFAENGIISPITGAGATCIGTTLALANTTPGGSWSSSNVSVATVSSTGVVSGISAGTAVISYDIGECITTAVVTVNPLPNPGTITGSSSVCAGSTTTLSNATSGGTWSSSNASVATVGSTGIVIGVASGTTTISYSATNGCGTVSATKIITVNSTPTSGTITGSSSVCVGNTITLSSTASGGAWTSSNSAIATVGTTGSVTGVASGATTISYTVSNECGSATATKAITVNPLPNAGTITGASTVNAGATITLSNTTTGGTWSSSTTTVATVGSTGVLSGVAAGVTTISYTVTNACGSAVATKVVTVNAVLETPITGTLTLCEGSNTTLSNATSGGAWSSSNTMKATVSSEGIVSGVSAGTAIISYTISGSTVTAVVTVNALPTVGTFTGSSTACVGGTLTLYNSVPGGTWSSSSDGATVSSTGEVTGVAEGYAIISYTVSNECGESVATKDILILSTPDAGTLSGTANICVGATTALSSSVSGGTWSSGYTAVATVDASGLVTGVGAGTATISYRMTNFCGTSYATQVVTVNPLPNAGAIGGANAVCVGATTTMPFISAAGVWSSSDPSVATINSSRVVTGIAAGVVTISHTVTNSCGTDVATKVMTVNPLPVAGTLSGATVVCAGANIAITPSVSGGTWLSSNASIASVSTSGEVTGVSAGVVTISYRVTNSCGIATATQAITVNPAVAVAAIGGLSSLCAGSTIALTNATTGGTWSSSNTSAATISSSGIVTGVAEGSTTISYTVSNSCGTATATKDITVNPLPVAGTISGASNLCTGTTITLSSTGTGGSWISGTPSVATISSEGVVSGIAAGVSIMTYRVINGCGTANATFAVTVSTAPTIAAISGPSLVCAGNNITLSNTTSGGTWVSSETSIATISSTGIVTGVAAGTSTISYVRTNGCGTVASTKEVTVLAQPVAGTLSGSNSLCVGATSVFSSTESGGTWSSSYPAGATVNSSTGLVTGVAVGSFIISYRMTNSCGTVYATRTVTVSPVPNAGTIGGANVVCVGATTTMPFISAAGVWSSSDPSVATINSSRVVTGVAVGIVTISHTVTTGCGSAVATKVITVNPLPVAGTLSGVSVVCVGNTATITPSVTGGTWSSNNPTKASVTTAGVVTGVSAGSAVISYRVTNSCGIATATHAVTVNPAVTVAAIGGSSSLCAGNTLTLTNTTTGGTWSSSNTSVATIGSTGIVTGVSQGVTTISYVISSSCGAAIATKTITVNPLPVAGTISGATSMCISTTTTLSTTGTGGTWISGNTGLATINSSGLVTAIAAGTAPITYRVINGCGTANAVHFVTISALPAIGASISGSPLACVGGTSEYSNPTGGGGGVWSSNNTSVATISSSTGTLTGISAGVVTISYVKTNGCGSSIATLVVTVLPLPVAGTISGTTPICSGTTSVFSSTESGGTWSSNYPAGATVSTTGVVTGITNGNFIISYRMTNSCGTAYASFPITVISVPALSTISGTATVCQAATTTLGNTISGGTWSSSNTAVATIATPTVGVVTGVATGTSTISYTASNTCGTSVVSRVVTVNSCARPGKTEGTGGSNSVFSVSPNPTTGVLNLTTSVAGVVVMYTIDGKELQQYEAKVGTTAITLPSGIASGVYMLRFTGADGSSRMTRLVYQQ